MDPTCRSCGDYPCTCGQAIGVPIYNGPDKPWTIRAGIGADMSETNFDEYQAQQEKRAKERAEREKEEKRKAEEERRQSIRDWLGEEGSDKPDIANLYLAWSAITGDAGLCNRALARGADFDRCFDIPLFTSDNECIKNPNFKESEFVNKISSHSPSTPSKTIHSITDQEGLGLRAIHIASAFGNLEVLKVLIACAKKSSRSNINANAGRGLIQFTPLLFAVRNEQVDCAKVLLEAGASRLIDDGWGMKPDAWATKTKNEEMIALINNPGVWGIVQRLVRGHPG